MGSPGLALSLHKKEVFGFYLNLTNDLLKKSNYFRLSSSILNLVSVKNKESGFYIFIIRLIISNLIKKTSFFLLQNEYLETSLSNEKELIEIIIKNNNLAKILSLHSKFVKDMHSASFLNISETERDLAKLNQFFTLLVTGVNENLEGKFLSQIKLKLGDNVWKHLDTTKPDISNFEKYKIFINTNYGGVSERISSCQSSI